MKAKAIISAAMLMICSMASAQTRETAVLFSSVDLDNSYLLTENVSVAFDSAGKGAIYAGETKVGDFDVTNIVTAEFKDAFKLKANKDPENPDNYYSTFYTSEGAYKVPENVKAYTGEVKTSNDNSVLKMTGVGDIIHQSEAVILKAADNNNNDNIIITLMPSCNTDIASTNNILIGTDEIKTLEANQYALSLGQDGVGFYLWVGKTIGANKAYLTIPSEAKVLKFDDNTAGIEEIVRPQNLTTSQPYNLNGVRVNDSYRGVVIKNGKRFYQR